MRTGAGLRTNTAIDSILNGSHTMTGWWNMYSHNGNGRVCASAWTNTINNTATWGIWYLWADGADSYYMKLTVSYGTNFYTTDASTLTADISLWLHWAVVVNRTAETVAYYLQGNLINTIDCSSNGIATRSSLYGFLNKLGNSASGPYAAYATCDESAIFSGALTGTDITALYNGGAGLSYADFLLL